MAQPATDRHDLTEEPDALTRTSGTVRGVPRKWHPYRDLATRALCGSPSDPTTGSSTLFSMHAFQLVPRAGHPQCRREPHRTP